jgi:hypothetical protein
MVKGPLPTERINEIITKYPRANKTIIMLLQELNLQLMVNPFVMADSARAMVELLEETGKYNGVVDEKSLDEFQLEYMISQSGLSDLPTGPSTH